jgi:hypothetical protein
MYNFIVEELELFVRGGGYLFIIYFGLAVFPLVSAPTQSHPTPLSLFLGRTKKRAEDFKLFPFIIIP